MHSGKVAAIHRRQRQVAVDELREIGEALDLAKVAEGETTAQRVTALAAEVIQLRRKVEDYEFDYPEIVKK